MDEKIENYILNIVFASRNPEKYGLPAFTNMISYGASPRASINLSLAAKAYAFIRRRGYVIPEDVRTICADVMRHRIGLTYEAEAENVNQDKIISEILNVVEVPDTFTSAAVEDFLAVHKSFNNSKLTWKQLIY